MRSTHLEIPVRNLILVTVDDRRSYLGHDAGDMLFGVWAGIIGGSAIDPLDNYVEEFAASPTQHTKPKKRSRYAPTRPSTRPICQHWLSIGAYKCSMTMFTDSLPAYTS